MSIYLPSYRIVIFVPKKYIGVLIIVCSVKNLVFSISYQKSNFMLYKIFKYNSFDFFSIEKNSWRFIYKAGFITFSISIYSWKIFYSLMICIANILIIVLKNILYVIIIKHSFCMANNFFWIKKTVLFI